MGTEHLIEGFGEVLPEVKAVSDLRGLRRTRAGAILIGFEAISGDDRASRMRVQPPSERGGLTVMKQRHWLVTREVHHDRPIALALPVGPVIDPHG